MSLKTIFYAALLGLAFGTPSFALTADPSVAPFTNVNVFDGENEALIENAKVFIAGNTITAVSTQALDYRQRARRCHSPSWRLSCPGAADVHRFPTTKGWRASAWHLHQVTHLRIS